MPRFLNRHAVAVAFSALLLAGPALALLAAGLLSPQATLVGLTPVLLLSLVGRLGPFLLLCTPLVLLAPLYVGFEILFDVSPTRELLLLLHTATVDEVSGYLSLTGLLLPAVLYVVAVCAYLLVAKMHWAVQLPRRLVLVALVLGTTSLAFVEDHEVVASYPLGGMLYLADALPAAYRTLQGARRERSPITVVATRNDDEVHVLVIGESLRFDALSINGYPRETTPLLAREARLVSFRNCHATANLTRQAVPPILTGERNPEQIRTDLFQVFGTAGYRTHWLVNQHVSISDIVQPAPDVFAYTPRDTGYSYGIEVPHDGVLLPHFRRALATPGKVFVALHTQGSHWDYASRYPPSFMKWGSGAGFADSDFYRKVRDQEKRDAYDNSVLYTDWFLAQLIAELKRETRPAALAYVSDHGENFAATENAVGHGSDNFHEKESHVAALVWFNEAYTKRHPGIVAQVGANREALFQTDTFFASMISLAGLNYDGATHLDDLTRPIGPKKRSAMIFDAGGGRLKTLADGRK